MSGLRAVGFRGGHCADPHKQAVLPFLDRRDRDGGLGRGFGEPDLPRGKRLGRRQYRGQSRVAGDPRQGSIPAGKRIVLLGAGRVARAVASNGRGGRRPALTIVNQHRKPGPRNSCACWPDNFAVPVAVAAWEADYAIPADAELLIQVTSIGQDAAEDDSGRRLCWIAYGSDLLVADVAAEKLTRMVALDRGRRGPWLPDGRWTDHVHRAGGDRIPVVDRRGPQREVLREAVEEFLEL